MQNINIKAVSKITGINENTLRAWERRYNVVEPARSEDGHRLYSRKDIDKLSLLWRLVQKGHLIGQLAELSFSQLKKLEGEMAAVADATGGAEISERSGSELNHLKVILRALKSFDLQGMHRGLQVAKFELSPRVIISDLVLPLLVEVGEQSMAKKLSVAQEHLLSSMLRDYLGNLYQSLAPYDYRSQLEEEKILLTTREGDLHEFGILLAAIICRLNGHETYYLGPNMPADDLARACEQLKISTIVLGLSMLPSAAELISAETYLRDLDRLAPRRIQILYGGSGAVEFKSAHSRQIIRFHSLNELDEFITKIV